MPINPKLKEQLEKTTMDDGYRQKLITMLDDAPADVQNLWMAREDYTRQVNAFNEEKKTWKATADKFYTDSNAAIDGWKAEVKKNTDALTAAQARITELENNGGLRTPGQEDAAVKEIAGLKTLITSLESKLSTGVITPEVLDQKLQGAYQSAVGFLGDQILTINELAAKHQMTFGERFDKAKQEALITFANEQSTKLGHRLSLDQAYEMQYADQSRKKWEADKEKEITERVTSQNRIPGAQGPAGPGVSDKGPLQIRLDEIKNQESGVKDGAGYRTWQEAAAAGADELIKEGKY